MIQEEDEDEEPEEYTEALGAALAQRGQKNASDKMHVGFVNPAFSTTDLWLKYQMETLTRGLRWTNDTSL